MYQKFQLPLLFILSISLLFISSCSQKRVNNKHFSKTQNTSSARHHNVMSIEINVQVSWK